MKLRHAIISLLSILILTSCAVGNQHSYHDTIANIAVSGNITVAATTHDQREYIVSGQSPLNYVGMQRGGFGNPFNVTTASGKPLAEDITTSICHSLSVKGFRAIAVNVAPSDNRNDVIAKLRTSESQRLLLLTLNELQSDTYSNVGFSYNMKLEVFDPNGNKLAEKSIKGDDSLGGSAWNPPERARGVIPKAFKEKLEALLNSGEILKTLQ
jgi:hypothetical protein